MAQPVLITYYVFSIPNEEMVLAVEWFDSDSFLEYYMETFLVRFDGAILIDDDDKRRGGLR